MNTHSKYDKMHKNGKYYALKCINNHVITSKHYMLLIIMRAFTKNYVPNVYK